MSKAIERTGKMGPKSKYEDFEAFSFWRENSFGRVVRGDIRAHCEAKLRTWEERVQLTPSRNWTVTEET